MAPKFFLGFFIWVLSIHPDVSHASNTEVTIAKQEVTSSPLSDTPSKEGERPNPVSFMQTLGDKVLNTTKTKQGRERKQALRKIFEAHIHHKSIAQFVLGKARNFLRAALKEVENEEEKKKLKKEIEDLLEIFYETYKESIIRIYLTSFNEDYKKMTFRASSVTEDGPDGVIVHSTLDRHNGADPITLDWVLKFFSPKGETQKRWHIVDVRVMEVSQATKERDETSAVFGQYRNECMQNMGKRCAVYALKHLIEKHRALNTSYESSFPQSGTVGA